MEESHIGNPVSASIEVFFRPRSVALIGATERPTSVGRTVLVNLVTGTFGGTVYPVNPKHETVLGLKAYATVDAIPQPVDLAVIATPAKTVPGVISQCVAKGAKGAIVLSAGFKETGPQGAALERDVLERARAGRLRVMGPNCLGVICPVTGLNASFARTGARPGTVGFASQSGALCTSILDWSLMQQFGFSAFISMGSMVDVGWGDVIYHLGDDAHTHSIVLYMESVGDVRRFLSAAREVALSKPIIVIKAGRTEAAAKAAASHTGALAGNDAVLDAAFERIGLLRVDSIEELFSMADVLAKQPRPMGKRLAIVTNAGGPAVLATDALVEGGGEIARLGESTVAALDAFLPPSWSHGDPVDVLGDATPERYSKAAETVAADPATDGLLVTYSPQASSPAEVAECITRITTPRFKPMLASWMGGLEVAPGAEILERAGIPTFPYPDTAARVFNLMWRYDANLRALLETPTLPPDGATTHRGPARALIARVLTERRTLLTEAESKQLLAAYEIATVPAVIAASAGAAVAAADSLGYPVAVKLHSAKVTHKSDVGGVRLRVADARGVELAFAQIAEAVAAKAGADAFGGVTVQPMIDTSEGYELIVGSSVDDQFGPVLLFGHGGELVEIVKDRALGLPPLTGTLARRMIEKTRISKAFGGVRGRRPVDLDAVEQTLVRLGNLVVDQPRVKEVDINPLLATPDRVIALDARVMLHPPGVPDEALPRTAIRPYPSQYAGRWTTADGVELEIRPVRPEDEPLMRQFHRRLFDESVYRRYAHAVRLEDRISHERLARLCFIDYAHEMALLVLRSNGSAGPELVAIGRLIMEHDRNEGELAMLVLDAYQGKGIGTEMLRRLLEVARREQVGRVVGYILAENVTMLEIARRLGFRGAQTPGDPMVESFIDLN